MKRSYLLAALLAIAAAGWIASGQLADGGSEPTASKPPADLSAADQVPLVRVRRQTAETRVDEVILRGRTEALRTVDVKAEIQGRVVELEIERGDSVTAGQVIARLAPEDRPAKVKEAQALRAQRRIELEAADKLSKKGYRAENQVAAARAVLEAAQAAVEQAQVALENTKILAPFDGLVDDRMVEIGDFLEKGDPVARVVDLDPLLVVGDVTERDVGDLEVGTQARARLITGAEVTGTLRFIGAMADANTRTFRVELEVANAERRLPDGVTAELFIPKGEADAHLVSPAILTLTDEGLVGVKTLEADGTVGFHPVQIMQSGPDGVWVTGLAQEVILITVGQEFVNVGQKVRAVEEDSLEPVAEAGGTS
jgi:multidrug efflux system membrane fusion protein